MKQNFLKGSFNNDIWYIFDSDSNNMVSPVTNLTIKETIETDDLESVKVTYLKFDVIKETTLSSFLNRSSRNENTSLYFFMKYLLNFLNYRMPIYKILVPKIYKIIHSKFPNLIPELNTFLSFEKNRIDELFSSIENEELQLLKQLENLKIKKENTNLLKNEFNNNFEIID